MRTVWLTISILVLSSNFAPAQDKVSQAASAGSGKSAVSLFHRDSLCLADHDLLALAPYYRQLSPHRESAADSGLTLLGRWGWGPCRAVGMWKHYAFIGNGPTFQALDLSDPSTPRIVSEYLTDNFVYDIQNRDSLVFVCEGDSLLFLDLSNPALPTKIGGYFMPMGSFDGAERVVLSDSLAFVLGFRNILQVIDISNLVQPRFRARIAVAGSINLGYGAFTCKGRYVYVSDVEMPAFVSIVDATNPDSLVRCPTLWLSGIVVSGITRGNLLLLGMQRYSNWTPGYAMAIYDISTPASPSFVSVLPDAGPNGFAVRDSIVFTTGNGALRAVDLSNPSLPKVIGSTTAGGAKVSAAGNLLTIAGYRRAYVVDISRADSLTMKAIMPTGGLAERVFVQDTLAYVASESGGLWILDVSDPTKPKGLSNINVGGAAYNLIVSGAYAYLMNPAQDYGDGARGLWIIDVSDPSHPQVLSHYVGITRFYGGGVPNAVAKLGNLLAITQMPTNGDDRIVELVDVSDPGNPKSVNVIHGQYPPYDVGFKDSLMFIASPDSGLICFSVLDPTGPNELSRVPILALAVAARDSLVFVVGPDLFVVDASNPRLPVTVGTTTIGYGFSNPAASLAGHFVYWADISGGAVDVFSPANPHQVITFQGKDMGRGIGARGNEIFYADETEGVWIWRNDFFTSVKSAQVNALPEGVRLLQNYPNPFNSQTQIEFSIAHRENISLEVFNILGQRVVTLKSGGLEPGRYRVPFSADQFASGVYFYQLRTPTTTITRPMIYLK